MRSGLGGNGVVAGAVRGGGSFAAAESGPDGVAQLVEAVARSLDAPDHGPNHADADGDHAPRADFAPGSEAVEEVAPLLPVIVLRDGVEHHWVHDVLAAQAGDVDCL